MEDLSKLTSIDKLEPKMLSLANQIGV